jgi:hypothetical protein
MICPTFPSFPRVQLVPAVPGYRPALDREPGNSTPTHITCKVKKEYKNARKAGF